MRDTNQCTVSEEAGREGGREGGSVHYMCMYVHGSAYTYTFFSKPLRLLVFVRFFFSFLLSSNVVH